jgi:hypothetical protein
MNKIIKKSTWPLAEILTECKRQHGKGTLICMPETVIYIPLSQLEKDHVFKREAFKHLETQLDQYHSIIVTKGIILLPLDPNDYDVANSVVAKSLLYQSKKRESIDVIAFSLIPKTQRELVKYLKIALPYLSRQHYVSIP